MSQESRTSQKMAARAPVFFWITVGLLALLFLGVAAAVVLLVYQAESINRSGGWGWLLVGGVFVATTTSSVQPVVYVLSFRYGDVKHIAECRSQS